MALLALLTAIWLIVDPRTPDMAAASYRVSLFASHGFSVLDANWYGGHDLPGYSLLFPPLGALLGLKAVAALSVIASSVLFARLARSLYGSAAAWGTALFVLAAIGDVWLGRIAFAFGVPFALAAALALRRGHPMLGGGAGAAVGGGQPGRGRAARAAWACRWPPPALGSAPAGAGATARAARGRARDAVPRRRL